MIKPRRPKPTVYVIGDVHGEARRLADLHATIFAHHDRDHRGAGMTIVHLGDYIDRGPDSHDVIERIRKLEANRACKVVSLKGNHEQMLLDAIDGASCQAELFWLNNGGQPTLDSYLRHGYVAIPQAHVDWLRALPSLHIEPESRLICVHAGLDVGRFPDGDEAVHLWTRSRQFFDADGWDNPALAGWRVVHGHTPTRDFTPERCGQAGQRINIDTGAAFGGTLTAAVFAPGREVSFLSA